MLRGRLSTEETDQGVTEALLVALRESELAQQTNREAMTALRRHHAAQVTEHEVEVSGLRWAPPSSRHPCTRLPLLPSHHLSPHAEGDSVLGQERDRATERGRQRRADDAPYSEQRDRHASRRGPAARGGEISPGRACDVADAIRSAAQSDRTASRGAERGLEPGDGRVAVRCTDVTAEVRK